MLLDYITMFPTPAASDFTSNIGGSEGRVGRERFSLTGMARYEKWPDEIPTMKHGALLNPVWVELLMGWPPGWTSLISLPATKEWGTWPDTWESDIARTVQSKEVSNRVGRVKAIGNGQVPLCAATAWELLSVR